MTNANVEFTLINTLSVSRNRVFFEVFLCFSHLYQGLFMMCITYLIYKQIEYFEFSIIKVNKDFEFVD